MLRALKDMDEVKMIGATILASVPIAATTLALRLGMAWRRDPDLLPGLGTFDYFACETDGDVLFTIATGDSAPQRAAIIGHRLADLPAIARALGVTVADFEPVASDPAKPWLVVRQDDNGNRFVLNRCETQGQAERAVALWTRRIDSHHQTVFAVCAPETAG